MLKHTVAPSGWHIYMDSGSGFDFGSPDGTVTAAGEMGFSHIQIATNGLRLADESFARQAHQAGLHTLYLQFDGVGEDAHRRTRKVKLGPHGTLTLAQARKQARRK